MRDVPITKAKSEVMKAKIDELKAKLKKK